MDLGTMLYNNLKDVSWSGTSLPLDQLVSSYRLPQIVRLDNGELVEGLRDNDYLLLHSCRQWTTITAHSLEEGHYVIGPKIEIPVHYEGQFKLLEQDRDVKEPVQYFNSVEEVAKAFPERVYVMEEITFNVKMASGECNEDTEVYNITLSTGDELTLMGQAEILYAKTSREKSRFNTIFKKIGKLNSISKQLGRGKMPCLICMNHRTNESVSLPFQCKGRFSTCSPLELQMQEGEHTIRDIVEKTRLPVNVTVPGTPPRNQHDLHLIREGHRYKLVNVGTKTVVVCCVLRSNKIVPVHFPFHAAMPRFIIPSGLLQGELWLDTMVHRWFTFCQEQFDIDDYSRAVRDVRVDWPDDGKSPKKSSGLGGVSLNGSCGGSNNGGCPVSSSSSSSHVVGSSSSHGGVHVPSSLTYARDELTQSFHRLSVCVYGNNLHGNSEVNLQVRGCMTLCGDWALLPSDCALPADSSSSSGGELSDHFFPELLDSGHAPLPSLLKSDVPYEELWLDHLRGAGRAGGVPKQSSLSSEGSGGGVCNSGGGGGGRGAGTNTVATSAALSSYPVTSCPAPSLGPVTSPVVDRSLSPPPVPPKSEAVKEECRLLNAPPIPPRSSKQAPVISKARQQETRSPSPTLSYYSSGLHNIGGCETTEAPEAAEEQQQSGVCYPCSSWTKSASTGDEANGSGTLSHGTSLPPSDGMSSRLSWPNNFSGGGGGGGESHYGTEDFPPTASSCSRSYYSYPRKRSPSTPKACSTTSSLFDFDGRERTLGFGGGGGGGDFRAQRASSGQFCVTSSSYTSSSYCDTYGHSKPMDERSAKQSVSCPSLPPRTPKSNVTSLNTTDSLARDKERGGGGTTPPPPKRPLSQHEQGTSTGTGNIYSISYSPNYLCVLPTPPAVPWRPPAELSGLSIEEVSRSLRFIGLPDDVVSLFVSEKIDGNLLLQLSDEILSEDFKLSKLQVKKLLQFINGWRPKI